MESIENACENWIESARHNIDKTKCILKIQYSESQPPDNIISLSRYSASEIKLILNESEWQITTAISDEPDQVTTTYKNMIWTGSSPTSVTTGL